MELASWLLYALLVVLVFCSQWSLVCAYVFPFVLLIQYTLLIWMIPLNLNWSRGLYSHLLGKSILLLCATVLSFSIAYQFYGVIDTASGETTKSYSTSLYFSVTTWSTLGYGDLRPLPAMRFLTSFEAILGVLSIPLVFTMIWKYCDFRIWSTSVEDEQEDRNELKLRLDERGVWKQLDDNMETLDLTQKYHLNPCKKCGCCKLAVERYFLITGFLSPRMQFMVHCPCGYHVFGRSLAMGAARAWNRRNPRQA